MGQFAEVGSGGNTLQEELLQDFSNENEQEKIFNMKDPSSSNDYEVRMKQIILDQNRKYRIAIVKDQTLFHQLIKETTIKKNQKMLLASISHEIRNPLNAIYGFISLGMDSVSLSETHCYYEKIRCFAEQIGYIVDGAMNLILAENEALASNPQPFQIREAIRDVVHMMKDNMKSKNLILKLNVNIGVPETVTSDERKYSLILFHLFANAIKYTEMGEIRLDVSHKLGVVKTSVSDEGIGIPEDKVAHLFELYSNCDRVNQYNPQGMGMGLALCHRLTSHLGGRIRVSSIFGKGSSFTFSIKNYSRCSQKNSQRFYSSPTQIDFLQQKSSFLKHDTHL
eukprot:TRINITY_DN16348_c0_g1_i1.p1 TRINITY_DN16348_c0_g1~~TRINITY_DN16348_c0_g1_i1.p1  ORF type:complete len:338 (+),score=33.47 TRINITY_DN16348_c0_g1_i1:197-1210(+)